MPAPSRAVLGLRLFAALFLTLAAIFAVVARLYFRRYPVSLSAAIGVYTGFVLYLGLALVPGVEGSRETARRWLAARPRTPVIAAAACVPYLAYAIGASDFRWAALVPLAAIAVMLPSLYAWFPVRKPSCFAWQDACVAGLLVFAALSHLLKGIWNVPVNLDFMARIFLIAVVSWCWVFIRPIPGLGYDLTLTLKALKAAALNFSYFAVVAIPAGLALHFIAWNPRWRGLPQFSLDFLTIFLFIALLEEMFFRGMLQVLISNSLRSQWAGQALVACLFGLFHILHTPFPNWPYVAMAAVAGWFYGSAFRNGGGLMASALTHAAVDTVWRTFLTKG
ncbi:MAG TPA: CPBP family intramembrane glutamic endopeptidase [Bryobacteraceae bacterium]|nr:CPBP family intramembrane glutamic endopeptidase [Bryobacteraceae bacterium]